LTVRVILVEPEKSGNIGAIARSMKNFGIDEMLIVNPKTKIDAEANAFAMHAQDVLASAKIVHNLGQALLGLDAIVGTSAIASKGTTNLQRQAISPRQLAQRISRSKARVGIVFGRESSGLKNKELEKCDFQVTIPANPRYRVLNIASAASIIFYELYTQRNAAMTDSASHAAKARMLSQFNQLAKKSHLPPHRLNATEKAFKNVISRSFVSKREASLLIGAFRKACLKMM